MNVLYHLNLLLWQLKGAVATKGFLAGGGGVATEYGFQLLQSDALALEIASLP